MSSTLHNRQHLNSLKGIETKLLFCIKGCSLLSPTTLEFPERDWNFKPLNDSFRLFCPTTLEFPERDWNCQGSEFRRSEHIPTTLEFPERDWNMETERNESGRCARQHLNSLKGIETCTVRRMTEIYWADNTWIPWKGLKLLGLGVITFSICTDNTWIPWKGLKRKQSRWQVWNFRGADNTWIPWKGLKPVLTGTGRLPSPLPTTLEFPERDWNLIRMIAGWVSGRYRQHLNSLKGIETYSSSASDILSRQHLNSLKGIETYNLLCKFINNFTDNTWIPWKGLKHCGVCVIETIAPYPRQHLNSLKGIETQWNCLSEYQLGPTTLEFPERDWNPKAISLFNRALASRQHLNSLKGIETCHLQNLHHYMPLPTTLEFPERDWNL